MLKTTGLADVIRKALEPVASRIRWAFIYGSLARSEEHSASDVDLMIVGHVGLADLSKSLRKAEQEIGRAVNPTAYTPNEFATRATANHHFVSAVMQSKKLFVLGDPREFGRTFGK
jgi:predicted nucleotidyltransferase